jgi:hypothetical protein
MRPFRNEKGIALVMILVLAAIALAIMTGLIFLITSGTQVSGVQKRYKTAIEAGLGGADITYQFIARRGEATGQNALLSALSTLNPVIYSASCTGTNIAGQSFTGLAAKLNTPSTSWSGSCNGLVASINPSLTSTYDMKFDLGTSPTYRVYAKIVDTVEGNSGGDEGLLKGGVVLSNTGEVNVLSIPYLYTIELDAENPSNPYERAKFSIIYQY